MSKARSKTSNSRSNSDFKSAIKARNAAHAPYSKFKVGAFLKTKNGKGFAGCNVENASYGGTICAERVAILKAVSEGHKKFDQIVVVADSSKLVPPCALCLQTMAEFCGPNFIVHLGDLKGIQKSYRLKELLPYPFNSTFL